jgi:hypothetical protein
MIDQFKNADGVGLPCRLSHATRAYDHMLKTAPLTDGFGFDEETQNELRREPTPEVPTSPRERLDSYNSDAESVASRKTGSVPPAWLL